MYAYDAKHSDHQIEFHQYQMRSISPNLMLTKVTLYTVFDKMA